MLQYVTLLSKEAFPYKLFFRLLRNFSQNYHNLIIIIIYREWRGGQEKIRCTQSKNN